ncbi:MAG: SUMF1/EgtB/PvdO family nonheme iron enzyme [Fibrobacteres bacterium]|nr:SUMF1/EgtB/PvdO family nonheme iron enzyme [Fibrobacterota bacterium]
MKKLIPLLLVLIGLLRCSADSPSPTSSTVDTSPAYKKNPMIAVAATSRAISGSDSLSYGSRPDERPVRTTALDSFSISAFEVMNHEFAQYIKLWSESFPSWDTVRKTDVTVITDKSLQLHTDTLYLHRGSLSKALIKINSSALLFTLDTTIDTVGADTIRISPNFTPTTIYKDYPVQGVSWFGAALYCCSKTISEGLTLTQCFDTAGLKFTPNLTGMGYRLPTEAEWEWVARDTLTGVNALYPTGSSISPDRANYGSSAVRVTGSFAPNSRKIYDLGGNLWEWCLDSYGAVFYTTAGSNPFNASANVANDTMVVRGGGYNDVVSTLRTARRSKAVPLYMGDDAGFRVVRR